MSSGFQLAQQQAQAYAAFTHTFMDGSARLLAEGAGIRTDDVVLDLACGTGLVARHVAPLLGPGGRLVGSDINPAMLAIARSLTDVDVEWVEAPCDALPFDDATFTHVLCQQGMQFFPDPVAALSEARRVLRPGGAVVATVWATPGHNPYIEHQLQLLATVDPAVAPSVARATPPHAGRFLAGAAEDAGFDRIDVTMLEHLVEVDDLATWFVAQTSSTPWGPTLAGLDHSERERLVTEMVERMQPYATSSGGHRIPFCSYRLEARRSGT